MQVKVFELTFPGTWIKCTDRDLASKIRDVISLLQEQLSKAALALNRFQECRQFDVDSAEHSTQEWERRRQEDKEIEDKLIKQIGNDEFYRNYSHYSLQAKIAAGRLRWARGEYPQDYAHAEMFVYAQTVLFAMDTIYKIIGRLAKMAVPQTVSDVREKFKDQFPYLIGMRDSAHHMEDRGLGLNKQGKPLGGPLNLDNLRDDFIGTTLNDGAFAELEISEDTLTIVTGFIQEIINAFDWLGAPEHYPH